MPTRRRWNNGMIGFNPSLAEVSHPWDPERQFGPPSFAESSSAAFYSLRIMLMNESSNIRRLCLVAKYLQ